MPSEVEALKARVEVLETSLLQLIAILAFTNSVEARKIYSRIAESQVSAS